MTYLMVWVIGFRFIGIYEIIIGIINIAKAIIQFGKPELFCEHCGTEVKSSDFRCPHCQVKLK